MRIIKCGNNEIEKGLIMTTLTKKDLLEAIEDMPMDAKIACLDYENYNEEANSYAFPSEVIFHEQRRIIVLC